MYIFGGCFLKCVVLECLWKKVEVVWMLVMVMLEWLVDVNISDIIVEFGLMYFDFDFGDFF